MRRECAKGLWRQHKGKEITLATIRKVFGLAEQHGRNGRRFRRCSGAPTEPEPGHEREDDAVEAPLTFSRIASSPRSKRRIIFAAQNPSCAKIPAKTAAATPPRLTAATSSERAFAILPIRALGLQAKWRRCDRRNGRPAALQGATP
ncbi:hypothetical protein MTO96_013850 [Rhipicephalus appendiculatus]